MTLWFKFEEAMRANGKVAEAGPDGALVWVSLLCLHTAKGRNGVVPASCCKPSRLRAEAVAFLGSFDPERIENAIQACVDANLIERVNDNGTPCAQNGVPCALRLRGWSDEHAVACSHCRKPNPEPSHKTCPDCRDARKVDRKASNGAGARKTRAHGAPRAQIGASVSHLAALDSDSVSDSDIPPTPQRGARADARGASAARRDPEPEPEPKPAAASADPDREPWRDLDDALRASHYHSDLPPLQRGIATRKKAEQLTGHLTPEAVQVLDERDGKQARKRGALITTWINDGTWPEELDERAERESHARAAARGRTADDGLEGVYGDTAKPAASVIGDVLARAKAGGS